MTTLVAGDFAVDMTTWAFTPGWHGTSHTPDGTEFVIEQSSTGKVDTFHGTGFGGYDQFGIPTLGVINGIDFEEDGNFLLSLSDFSMTVQQQRAFSNVQDMAGWQSVLFAGNDSFFGSPEDDNLFGLGGDDTFDLTQGGSDIVSGGSGGDDFVMGSEFDADDQIDGGSEHDSVHLDGDYSEGVVFNATTITNIELIDGAEGNDYSLTLHDGNLQSFQSLTADFSDLDQFDSLNFDGSAETSGSFYVIGGAGDDTETGGGGSDFLDAGIGGNDTLTGNDGNDVLASHDGTADMNGGEGDDTFVIDGGEGFIITGAQDHARTNGAGSDIFISDSSGHETIDARDANSAAFLDLDFGGSIAGRGVSIDEGTIIEDVQGTQFNDQIYGNDVANALYGNNGKDYLDGAEGNDYLNGGKGNDHLVGGDGDDRLTGGSGKDILDGGEGADIFHFLTNVANTRKTSTIVGFDSTEDRIDIKMHVTGIDETVYGQGSLESLVGADELGIKHAVLVVKGAPPAAGGASPSGEGEGPSIYLIVNTDGVAGYQAGSDLAILLENPVDVDHLDIHDFI